MMDVVSLGQYVRTYTYCSLHR